MKIKMKIIQDYILYFTENEWKSFPRELQDTLFGHYRVYMIQFPEQMEFEGLELTNSIQIKQSDFLCAVEDSMTWEEFDKWLEERDYKLCYDYWWNEKDSHWFYNYEDNDNLGHFIHPKDQVEYPDYYDYGNWDYNKYYD